MPLATALTRLGARLGSGLEAGAAELLDQATPTTAELLRWWFGDDACRAREHNFHVGQRRAIVNAIVGHEVLASADLGDLYRRLQIVAPSPARCSDAPAHPKYCLKMATGTGKTWVLQALLIWQMLNRTAALAAGHDDPRFSRRFLIVAPGLIVHERLLDALLGRRRDPGARDDGGRDFATADIVRHAELLLPPSQRTRVQQFVRDNVCDRHEIARRTTGNGLIALTNRHLLVGAAQEAAGAETAETAPAAPLAPDAIARMVLPLPPGRGVGNRLDVLDRQRERGKLLAFLAALPDLVVFNDEAHHLHAGRSPHEGVRAQWQASLDAVARCKRRRFVQFDFSATPYEQTGSGAHPNRCYFPHVVADFDLAEAIRRGLVKSPVLERRGELDALPLAFKAERNERGNIALAEGQRVMLRIGLEKLRVLERDFAAIDPERRPKMLVVCEDTRVSPLVARFLQDEGLHPDDVLSVDSERKAELDEAQWALVRRQLFDIDRRARPRVIVSVLMLREGFDVDNICVIVPLRASRGQILLEQTIGRGLRLMWREPAFAGLRDDNRERIGRGEPPASLIDVLTIVEHPAFQRFYDTLIAQGLVGASGPAADTGSTGDLLAVELRADYQAFDFAVPLMLREANKIVQHGRIDIDSLPAFDATPQAITAMLREAGEREKEIGHGEPSALRDGRLGKPVGYNELLSRLTHLIGGALSQPRVQGDGAIRRAFPYLPSEPDLLAAALDGYIRARLFGHVFDPLHGADWRVLLREPIIVHLVQTFVRALVHTGERITVGASAVRHRRLSELARFTVGRCASIEVGKCIYTRLPSHSADDGFEREFMQWVQTDASVEAFCRIDPHRHDFLRIPYFRHDGSAGTCIADFLVRTDCGIYLVATSAARGAPPLDTHRARRATAAWCARINRLPQTERSARQWHGLSISGPAFRDWQCDGAPLADLLLRAATPAPATSG
ncbi:MAG: DEAD/DEAH box helicase family protein [Pseudomonadota bacterium]|nr:DEAD/DEAH box helicase family protein [Pseudomonadota bacterium]